MKWKNEIPNKTEFMKINSFNFIEGEKFHGELVHEKNFGKFQQKRNETSQRKEVKETIGSSDNLESAVEADNTKERRTMSETITLTKSKTDFTGSAPKRYTTKCFIKPKVVPFWYTESLFLNINSSKRKYDEKVYFKNKMVPFHWTENMTTEIKTGPKCIYSEMIIPIDEPEENVHYISLIPQQQAAKSTDL